MFQVQEKEVEKIVEKTVNPYEGLMDQNDLNYFEFKKNTGRSRKEHDFIQKDLDSVPDLDWVKKKLQRIDPNRKITNEEVNEYLEHKLNVDLADEDKSQFNNYEIKNFIKDIKEESKKLQEEYKKPTENYIPNQQQEDIVTLENGQKMFKSQYETLMNERKEYVDLVKQGVSSATSLAVESIIENNGEKMPLNFTYEFTDDDRHSMLSDASDVDGFLKKNFMGEKGLDHQRLATFIHKGMHFDKYMEMAMKEVRARTLEEFISNSNNEDFTQKEIKKNKTKKDGYGSFPDKQNNGFGVQL
ncbi:hypothetical protein SAMN04489761_4290 [Tenacibaculum sp. MAR_2009_124]|uniref:hypothetical protein n=1 Tax=Tenacibaculum sp. MAR_2009_124 TaxID=1250059 RepID=UPI00089B50BF|nr:hypothetical protein [Tenacibaculum sp. MAR_2009_124]SED10524.1 hypothetical protein SAMN04489761_4290 [Tenacibaculum sp. MAR_2009_124]